MYDELCVTMIKYMIFSLILCCFCKFLGFCPKTAWRARVCRKATHLCCLWFWILVWIAWQWWISTRLRDTVCGSICVFGVEVIATFECVLGEQYCVLTVITFK